MSSARSIGSPCPLIRPPPSTRHWPHTRDALYAEWKHDGGGSARPPAPTNSAAFMRLVQTGWDVEAARRPLGQHTTVVVHVDVAARIAALHLGPLLSDADRQYLTCDATCEVSFERCGQVIGAGRATR